MFYAKKAQKGFTLLEVLLVIAFIGIISAFSLPVYQVFQQKNNIDTAENLFVQVIRRAQILSQAVSGDSTWGVKIENGVITLFKGINYATRDNAYDEIFDMPSNIEISGLSEIVFNKLTGETVNTGDTIFTITNNTKFFTVNKKGVVTY